MATIEIKTIQEQRSWRSSGHARGASALGLCSREMMAGREPATAVLGGLSGFPLTILAATSNE